MIITAAQEVELGISERKGRERVEREQRIVASARSIAEAEGWAAVTIRRLAEEVEYSQPVLYSHFANRDAIVAAVAVEGFREIAMALQRAAPRSTDRGTALRGVAIAYLAFAREHPAVYQAMFAMRTDLHFAEADTRPELRGGFAALAAAIPPSVSDIEVATETFWAALHGQAELERSGRIRPSARDERIALLCDLFER
jgi:AcrR family transcriptional regulator